MRCSCRPWCSDVAPTTCSGCGDAATRRSGSAGFSRPLVEAIFRLRPVRSDDDTIQHTHPADNAEGVHTGEPGTDVVVITVTESLVSERLHHAQRPSLVRTVADGEGPLLVQRDRKSTLLNSSHEWISYAVFCLKKKKNTNSGSFYDKNKNIGNNELGSIIIN